MVLWNDAPPPFKTAIEGYHPSATVSRFGAECKCKSLISVLTIRMERKKETELGRFVFFLRQTFV